MDSALPSYVQATTQDHWSIISSFVRSQDLCSATLVSKQWNSIFTPHLWGNPASHFGTENDAVYIALVRFKRTLSWARLSTRALTHTLRMPPAQAELYDGPRAEWLRDILSRLPRLQSLIVSGLPFFDHGALKSLATRSVLDRSDTSLASTLNLRLLEAISCVNTTSVGLAEALKHFPSLVYLDLSRTLPARSSQVIASLRLLPTLRILKLRGLGLKDEDVHSLVRAVGLRLRSLDIRDNRLTDQSVNILLRECFTTPNQAAGIIRRNMAESAGLTASMVEYFGVSIPEIYKTQDQDHFVYKRLNSGFFDHLGFEDTCGTGLTHLYISGNQISVVAIAKLLRSRRLHVLNAGQVVEDFEADSSSTSNPRSGRHLGAESLVPLLELCGPSLSYLRLDHSVVTKNTTSSVSTIPEVGGGTNQGVSELDSKESAVYELEGDGRAVQELPPDPSCFELEGSPIPSASPKASPIEKPDLSEKGALYDHVSVPESAIPSKTPPVLSLDNSSSPTAAVALPSSSDQLKPPDVTGVASRQRTLSGIIAGHDARLAFRMSQPHGLLPSMLPSLQTLILTDVPTHFPSPEASINIISFISACAEEAYWSSIQSKHAYTLPPGRDRTSAEKTYAKSLFALRRIILEMKQVSPVRNVAGPMSPSFVGKSSVEDPDCEDFWTAGEKDFSFFGPGEEECGLPDVGIEKRVPLEARMGKMVVGERPGNPPPLLSRWSSGPRTNSMEVKPPVLVEMVDVLAAVSKFRKERKAEYQNAMNRGEVSPYIEGYWEGDIVVVRPGQ